MKLLPVASQTPQRLEQARSLKSGLLFCIAHQYGCPCEIAEVRDEKRNVMLNRAACALG